MHDDSTPPPSKPAHHRADGGFRNSPSSEAHGGIAALRWMAKFALKPYRRVHFPVHAVHLPPGDSLTWIGHSTFLLRFGELTVLTDPHFSERASPLRFAGPQRLAAPALRIDELPPVDLVLISHNHYDHLDEASVTHLAHRHPQARFIVPLRLAAWFARRGIHTVHELDWWQSVAIGPARVHAVPAQHFSGRSLRDRNRTLWCGYVLEQTTPDGLRRIYFAGDTGYAPLFTEIGARFAPIDLALIPIGAYEPRWFMHPMHVDPDEAVKIHCDIGSRQSIAMHWGTFRLTEEPLDEPPQRLRRALDDAGIPHERFLVMRHGQSHSLFAAADTTHPRIAQKDS